LISKVFDLPKLLETIKIENGEIFNLSYHQKRFDKSRQDLFNINTPIDLSSLIDPPLEGLYRCRVIYEQDIESIEYIPYRAKQIHTLKVISSTISYDHKFLNRDTFTSLLEDNPDFDEIIIEKEGYITDTTISNLAFYDGEQWFTPHTPLLEGTMRAKLLDEGFLHTRNIKKGDLALYTQVALINAMLGFKIINPTIVT
jgi:4-amino-4-deoxychorismate lyase